MNYSDPLDRLLLEAIPHRITPAGSHPDGPTAAFREYDNERQKWAAVNEAFRREVEIGDEESEVA